jgi:glycosyltransferase involved in cell wall biosynthesis
MRKKQQPESIDMSHLKGTAVQQKSKEDIKSLDMSRIINHNWEFIRNNGRITDKKWRDLGSYDQVMDFWKNEPCYVVGAGKSLDGFDFSLLNGYHSIGINHMIDFYDGFEWLIFIDQRFLQLNKYDLKQFKGRIYTQNITLIDPNLNAVIFKQKNDSPSLDISDGLFKCKLTGLCALNLAILSGANPIYLLGFDGGAIKTDNHEHHINGYISEKKTEKYCSNYILRSPDFDAFKPWKDRIVNLSPQSNIGTFRKESWQGHFAEKQTCIEIKTEQLPKIIHLSFTDKIEEMAEASRHIITKAYGNHILKKFDDPFDASANLYILHHYMGTDKKVNIFPYKEKAIDFVHSSNCIPRGNFKKVITLTETWKKFLELDGVQDVGVITNGLDIDAYIEDFPKFEYKTFGRITRWTNGKINPGWFNMVKEILQENQQAKNLMFVQMQKGSKPRPEGDRIIYNESVRIDEYKGKYLKQLSVYVHANDGFREICNHGLIEALATGLPIVLLYDESSAEVLGDAGMICHDMDAVKNNILILLNNKTEWVKQLKLSKVRAEFYRFDKMITEWNKLIKECLKQWCR